MARKGIVLAGGAGTRLHPLTLCVSKQVLPVYDKPMIYYPVSVLMLAGIRELLIISTPTDLPLFRKLLGDGAPMGVSFQYLEQPEPRGIAEAFIIGKDFIGDDPVALILGDNIFYGHGLSDQLQRISATFDRSTIFGYQVADPQRYGVVEFDDNQNVVSIEEKPATPKSQHAVVGLYFYNNDVVGIAETLQPSARGELEITDINNALLAQGLLDVELLGRGIAWLDTGTHESLQQASMYVEAVQSRQNLRIAALEEIAYRLGYIDRIQLRALADRLGKSDYADYLRRVGDGAIH